MQDKSEATVLVGYHSTEAYKQYNPMTNEICISRDVVVNETKSWDWTTQCSSLKNQSVPVIIEDKEGRQDDKYGNEEAYI